MAVSGISATTGNAAFGLDFQSLLRIILTQLTYQDPLKPLDNFQFVSQLAQFSQLQQSQTLNDSISSLLSAQSATQATGLLGRTVDYRASDDTLLSGTVKAISFANGAPQLTIQTADGKTISGLGLADVNQVR